MLDFRLAIGAPFEYGFGWDNVQNAVPLIIPTHLTKIEAVIEGAQISNESYWWT